MNYIVFKLYVILTVVSTGSSFTYPAKPEYATKEACIKEINLQEKSIELLLLQKGLSINIDYKMKFICRPGTHEA